MEYIIIDKLGGGKHAFILSNEDGSNIVFTDKAQAQAFCDENAQDGIVVTV